MAILLATGLRLSYEFLLFGGIAAGLAGLAGFGRWRSHPWQITNIALLGGLVVASLLLCALVANTGLRLGLPVADPFLAGGDAHLGLDVRRVTHTVAAFPSGSTVLYWLYFASGLMCIAGVGWSLVRGDRTGLWQVLATIVIAMQATAIISIFLPAQGATAYFGLDLLQGNGLPHGAGTYALEAFDHFYRGTGLLVTMADINGIVCFPSFHTVMALIFLQSFARSALRWPAVILSALTILSTIPMGGHYATDILGGIAIWFCSACLATRASWSSSASTPRAAWPQGSAVPA